MATVRNLLTGRTVRRAALVLFLIVLALVIAIRVLTATPIGRDIVEARIEGMSVRGQSVELEGLAGDLLGLFRIDRVRVVDEDGAWLVAETVAVRWSPLALLSGRVSVDALTAQTMDVARRPELRASQTQSGRSRFSAYRLGDARVETLRLAEGVAGPEAAYAVRGSVLLDGALGDISAEVTPRAAGGDVLDMDLEWGADQPLEGHATVRGKPGGLISTLIDAPPDDVINIAVDASRNSGDWSLVARGQVGEREVIIIEGQQAGEKTFIRGDADLSLSGRTRALSERLGAPVVFDLQLEPNGQGMDAILELASPTLDMTAGGSLLETEGSFSINGLDARVSVSDAEMLTGLEKVGLETVRAVGDLARENGAYVFRGDVTSPRLSYGNQRGRPVLVSGEASLEGGEIDLDVDIEAETVLGFSGPLGDALAGRLKMSLDGQYEFAEARLYAERFSLASDVARLNGAGVASADDALNLAGRLRVRPDAGLPANGEVKWTVRRGDDGQIVGTVSGNVRPVVADPELAALIGEELTVDGSFLRDEGGGVSVRDVRVGGARLTGEGRGRLAGGAVSAVVAVSMEANEVRGVAFEPLSARFDITGPLDAMAVSGNVTTPRVTAYGETLEGVDASFDAALLDARGGSLLIAGQWRDAPLQVFANGAISDGGWSLALLEAHWAALRLSGSGRGDERGMRGIDADIAVSGALPTGGEIDGQVTVVSGTLNGALALADIETETFSLSDAVVDLDGTWPRIRAQGQMDGAFTALGVSNPFAMRPTVLSNLEAREVTIDLEGVVAGTPVRTLDPIAIVLGDAGTLRGRLSAFGGEISVGKAAGQFEVSLDDVALSELGPIVGRPSLQGALNGAVMMRNVEGRIEGEADAQLMGLARGAPDAPSADIEINAALVGDQLTATLKATDGEGDLDMIAQVDAPMITDFAVRRIAVDPGQDTRLILEGGGPIAPIWAMMAPPDLRVEGVVALDLKAEGPLSDLRPSGVASLQQGILEDGVTGLFLKEISLDADVYPDAISARNVSATGGRSGMVTGAGRYAFDGSGVVALSLDKLDAFDRRDVRATVSGDLAMSRGEGVTNLSGDLRVDRANVDVVHLPGSSYTTLDVRFEDDDEPDIDVDERGGVQLNVGLKADRRVFVDGSGVETEWALDARIMGSPGAPDLSGQATLVRGEAVLLGRRFRFDEGRISFDGPPIATEVRIRASRTSGDITAIVAVDGPVRDPAITLQSEPALPDDEVLSRALFGRSPSQLGPLQAAELAGAAATLAGGDGFDLTGPLRAATGLDRVELGVGADGGATVSTGTYVADDVYLRIETGASGAPGVSVEWTPFDNVEVDADIDPELGPRLEINWKRDFDSFGFVSRDAAREASTPAEGAQDGTSP